MTLRLDQHLPSPDQPEAGPPLLFVHGAWHGAWVWENFLPWFAERGYRSYALDLRGHGQLARGSATDPDPAPLLRHRVADYVADLSAAVAQVGSPAPVLVGHSMGGMIVQKYLERRDAPLAVLMASVPPRGALGSTLRGLKRHPVAVLRALLTLDLRHFLETTELVHDFLLSPETPEEVVRSVHARVNDESLLAYLDMVALDLPDPRRVTCPVAVIGARDDGIFSHLEVQRTAFAFRHVLVRGVPDPVPTFVPGGHDLMLDVGWELAAEAVLAAVRRATGR